MSKYIRTKDGIYETWENGETYNGFGCKFNYGTIKIHKKDVINQADTIEELCDEFVGYVGEEYVKENETYDMPNYQEYDLKEMLFHMSYNKEDCVVYGAIWTSKGLIFVAKMNDKGELELI